MILNFYHRQWKEASRSLYKYQNDVKGENYKLDNLQFLIIRNSGQISLCVCLFFCFSLLSDEVIFVRTFITNGSTKCCFRYDQ